MPLYKRGRKGKQGKQEKAALPPPPPLSPPNNSKPKSNPGLILTSDRRRGIYECDYCGTDISRIPRIRCAVCDDFDLCIDCFATTDHVTAMAQLRAARAAQSLPNKDHDPTTHGYRVCDSTRYPMFPVGAKQQLIAKHKKDEDKDSTAEGNDAMETEKTPIDATEQDKAPVEPDTDDDRKNKAVDDENPVEDSETGALVLQAGEDNKTTWTVEEDLRLLRGIETHGLGNWPDIADEVAGSGSVGKTAKRCMERYLDDFLGRYGYILPPYTLVSEHEEGEESEIPDDAKPEEETTRSSKRRALLRSPSAMSGSSTVSKKYKAVATESLPEYQKVWPNPYLPEHAELGQEVGRDQAIRSEQAYIRTIASMTAEQAEKTRKEWEENRLNKPGGPTALPMRPDDVPKLPGSELVGFMPRRGDFDVEWENDAEEAIADMEFTQGESEQDRNLKLQVLAIYNSKLDERERRKKFVISRKIYDYRRRQEEFEKLPRDERDLVHRMRLFERFHTPAEHQQFLADLLKAKRLRKEIAKLQMYRRMGIRTLADAELYELDKSRRQFHKSVNAQKEAEAKQVESSAPADGSAKPVAEDDSPYWKQYRTTDRKIRKSVNRGNSFLNSDEGTPTSSASPGDAKPQAITDTVSVVVGPPSDNAEEDAEKQIAATPFQAFVDDKLTNASTPALEKPDPEAENAAEVVQANEEKMDESVTRQPSAQATAVPTDIDTSQEKVEGLAEAQESTDAMDIVHQDSDEALQIPGFNLLSPRELDVCRSVEIKPAQYLEIKRYLISESLKEGLLDGKVQNKNISTGKFAKKLGVGSQRTLVKIDVERRGEIIDFVVRAGWISTKFGKSVQAEL